MQYLHACVRDNADNSVITKLHVWSCISNNASMIYCRDKIGEVLFFALYFYSYMLYVVIFIMNMLYT